MIWVLIAILFVLLVVLFLPVNLNVFYNGNFCVSIKVLFFKFVIPIQKDKQTIDEKPKKSVKTITAKIDSNIPCEIEIRRILKKYPDAEIYIYNISTDEESTNIIQNLSMDYPRLHIQTKKGL